MSCWWSSRTRRNSRSLTVRAANCRALADATCRKRGGGLRALGGERPHDLPAHQALGRDRQLSRGRRYEPPGDRGSGAGEERIRARSQFRRERPGKRSREGIRDRIGQRDRMQDDVAQPVEHQFGQLRQDDVEGIDLVHLNGGVTHREIDVLAVERGAFDHRAIDGTETSQPAQDLIERQCELDGEALGVRSTRTWRSGAVAGPARSASAPHPRAAVRQPGGRWCPRRRAAPGRRPLLWPAGASHPGACRPARTRTRPATPRGHACRPAATP